MGACRIPEPKEDIGKLDGGIDMVRVFRQDPLIFTPGFIEGVGTVGKHPGQGQPCRFIRDIAFGQDPF